MSYQGYPYTRPVTTEVPTLSADQLAARSKWNQLPITRLKDISKTQKSEVKHQLKKLKNTLKTHYEDNLQKIGLSEPRTPSEDRQTMPTTRAMPLPPSPIETQGPGLQNSHLTEWAVPFPPSPKPSSSKEEEVSRPVVYIDLPDEGSGSQTTQRPTTRAVPLPPSTRPPRRPPPRKDEERPVVYIDLPDDQPGSLTTQSTPTRQPPSPTKSSSSKDEDSPPVVYIDLPEDQNPGSTSQVSYPNSPSKEDPDANPRVYIDLPDAGVQTRTETEPDYVKETIFYDPFKDRRVQPRDLGAGPSGSRPNPPATLNIASSSTSGYSSQPYQQPSPDPFPLSPIPVSEFPQPPPSYEEVTALPAIPRAVTEQPKPAPTQVITQNHGVNVVGLPHYSRKFLPCPHCGNMVHTLVIRENGLFTHLCALTWFILCLWPLTVAAYLMKSCKYKNHYCPHCNQKIGYEQPFCCKTLTYSTP